MLGGHIPGFPTPVTVIFAAPCQVQAGEERLVTAARSLQMAWHVVQQKLSIPELEKSLLATGTTHVSTSCTGVYTAEVGLALIETVVNDSGILGSVRLEPASCHETSLKIST